VKKLSYAMVAVAALVLAVGCGGGSGHGVDIKAGDKVELTVYKEREKFDVFLGEKVKAPTHNDGGFAPIPAGTVFEVYTTPRKEAKTFQVIPIKTTIEVVNEEDGTRSTRETSDREEVTAAFVPERMRDGRVAPFMYYTFSFDISLIGTDFKKVE